MKLSRTLVRSSPFLLFGLLLGLGGNLGEASAQTESAPASSSVFEPRAELDLLALERVVRERSPALQSAELEIDEARAEVRQSQLWGNPVLDGSWDTIPVGETNPPGLEHPFARIPNYGVGLSYTFLMGKRGPKQERALALARSAVASRDVAIREHALELAHVLGDVATTLLRLEGMRSLAREGADAISLAEARVQAKFGVPLEVDRLRIEVDRTNQQLLDAEGDLMGALAACSSLIGSSCRPFQGSEEARLFLEGWIGRMQRAEGRIEERPDLRKWEAERVAAQAELSYAKALAIPDPTVRVGFVHDRFLISGNQMNSVNLSVSVPLPFFDRGQAQRSVAEARHARASALRERIVSASEATIPVLKRRIEVYVRQQKLLQEDILPRAREVMQSLERAAESRLVPMTDVLQARRAWSELLLDEANCYRDAFDAALLLAAELPSASSAAAPAPGGAR